jgi:hypothetical protein
MDHPHTNSQAPTQNQSDSQSADAPSRLPQDVVLSIEPATAAAAGVDNQVPVIVPGYVLPDDSFEEPGHEGS